MMNEYRLTIDIEAVTGHGVTLAQATDALRPHFNIRDARLEYVMESGNEAPELRWARRLPEFVTVMSRTATSARWWCDACDWGGGWVSPQEAWDGSVAHVDSCHPKATP